MTYNSEFLLSKNIKKWRCDITMKKNVFFINASVASSIHATVFSLKQKTNCFSPYIKISKEIRHRFEKKFLILVKNCKKCLINRAIFKISKKLFSLSDTVIISSLSDENYSSSTANKVEKRSFEKNAFIISQSAYLLRSTRKAVTFNSTLRAERRKWMQTSVKLAARCRRWSRVVECGGENSRP